MKYYVHVLYMYMLHGLFWLIPLSLLASHPRQLGKIRRGGGIGWSKQEGWGNYLVGPAQFPPPPPPPFPMGEIRLSNKWRCKLANRLVDLSVVIPPPPSTHDDGPVYHPSPLPIQ
jgi:hypothetical protein